MIPVLAGRRVDLEPRSGPDLYLTTRLPLAPCEPVELTRLYDLALDDWRAVAHGLGLTPTTEPSALVTHGQTSWLRVQGEVTPAP